jgi:alcohol dehydrogenase (NADP+)
MIDIQNLNDAYKKIEKGDVRFRYVIDMASLKNEAAV